MPPPTPPQPTPQPGKDSGKDSGKDVGGDHSKLQAEVDWRSIMERAGPYPLEAFRFVREGLDHTVERASALGRAGGHDRSGQLANPESRHVSGQQLCLGLRDYAILQYGMLAPAVLRHWHITRTEDFGRIVYAMIDGEIMSKTPDDSEHDFAGVYDFEEAFSAAQLSQRIGT